jgi:hypothetical protein
MGMGVLGVAAARWSEGDSIIQYHSKAEAYIDINPHSQSAKEKRWWGPFGVEQVGCDSDDSRTQGEADRQCVSRVHCSKRVLML